MLETDSGSTEGCGAQMGVELTITLQFPSVTQDSTSVPVVLSLLFSSLLPPLSLP